jgi:DNA-binding transcriptional regulator YhcF (GntR family)
VIYGLGPRAQRVYTTLRDRIVNGELPPGTKLPAHTALAIEFGVAPLTLRQVLAYLEQEGYVSREQGRGTYIRTPSAPVVLIVEDDPSTVALLRAYIARAGHRPIEAGSVEQATAILAENRDVAMVLSDLRMPTTEAGVAFIQAVRRRWPEIPLAAVTGHPDDLAQLHGSPEFPILVIPKPIRAHQVEEALRLAIRPRTVAGANMVPVE